MPREAIEVEVGPQYVPMSRPVEDSKRVNNSDLTVELVQEKDLKDCARLMHQSFPDWWWRQYEPEADQPPEDIRQERLAFRLAAFLHHPSLVGVVARYKGELAGFAGWSTPRVGASEPALKSLPDLPPTFMPNHFRKDVLDEIMPPALGLTDAQWADVWVGVNIDLWESKFASYDVDRLRIINARPHWFLAPIVVDERFRGCGVGGALMRWAVERADAGIIDVKGGDMGTAAKGDPAVMYLESFPNARPVYMRYGFVLDQDCEGVMVREARPKQD